MNKTYLIVILTFVTFLIIVRFAQWFVSWRSKTAEQFENILTSQLDAVKKFISNYLEDDSNLEAPYVSELLNHFNDSQNESLANRLNKFKENLSNTNEFDK